MRRLIDQLAPDGPLALAGFSFGAFVTSHVVQALGEARLPQALVLVGTAASRFDLAFRLDQLAFDDPLHRATLGPAFASLISAEDTIGTRNNMLGDNNFQAARFPWVRIQSLQIAGEAPKFAAHIAVELHGERRDMWTPLTVSGLPGQLQVEGALVLRQSDFGVQPLSVLGGLLAVQDEVIVEFKLAGEAP